MHLLAAVCSTRTDSHGMWEQRCGSLLHSRVLAGHGRYSYINMGAQQPLLCWGLLGCMGLGTSPFLSSQEG